MNEKMFKETNVGKKLSDLTVQRLICIVIAIIFTMPLFQIGTYQSGDFYTANEGGLAMINLYQTLNDQN